MRFADDDALRAVMSHEYARAVRISHLPRRTRWIPQQTQAGGAPNEGTREILLRKPKPAGNAPQHSGTDTFHRDEMRPNNLSPARDDCLCWHWRWTSERITRINGG